MPLSPTAQRWARLLADQEQSNLTTRAFAAQHDVNPSTLNWWRCELRKREPAFIEVRLATVVTPPSALRLEFTAFRLAMDVPVGADLDWVREVVRALS